MILATTRTGLLVLALTLGASAQPILQDSAAPADVAQQRFEGTREYLAKAIKSGAYLGAVAMVEIAGERVFQSVSGKRDVAADAAMELDSIFRIYSMTKPVTAVAALLLCEAGKLELDAPVAKYLPEFEGIEVGVEAQDEDGESVLKRVPAKRPMSVRDLARHTAGLTYGVFAQSAVDTLVRGAQVFDPRITNSQLVERLAQIPLKTQPGTVFEYSLASDVLGRVIEVASEQTLGEFMREQIFEPLGMRDTGFFVPQDKLGRVAVCYRRGTGFKLVPTSLGQALAAERGGKLESGGGGLFSTANDYMLFCRMLLGGGALGNVRILQEQSVQEMFRDQLTEIPGPKPIMAGGAFGLGLAVITPKRERGPNSGTVWWGGYAGTGFWIDPEAQTIGIFMIQNLNEILHSGSFRRSVYKALGR